MRALLSGVATHLGIAANRDDTLRSPGLAAADSTDSAATEVKTTRSRTVRRRLLRNQHKDRVARRTFVIDLQFKGLRSEIAELKRQIRDERTYSRETLLSLSPIDSARHVRSAEQAPLAVAHESSCDA